MFRRLLRPLFFAASLIVTLGALVGVSFLCHWLLPSIVSFFTMFLCWVIVAVGCQEGTFRLAKRLGFWP